MKKVLVLGSGLVGATIARDLADDFEVTIVDKRAESLARVNDDRVALVSGNALASDDFIKPFDIVVGALPGSIGEVAAHTVLNLGKDYVDISFGPEDLRELSELAWTQNARCLIDFGLGPGLTHLVYGHFKETLKEVKKYTIYVGGLLRYAGDHPPWHYKAPWSPADVIEEYIRPARFLKDGEVKTMPAMSMPEELFLECGRVEAFLTDGVRSLLTQGSGTIVEKTIRPVGYRDKVQLLIDSGFFSEEPTLVKGHEMRPRDLTEKLLIDSWKIDENDQDMSVMKLDVEGVDCLGHDVRRSYDLIDYHDGVNSSMARTTGFMCAAGVRLLANDLWEEPGVFAPEEIGENRWCFEFVLEDLKRHGIKLT